jgi:hypothetical protein
MQKVSVLPQNNPIHPVYPVQKKNPELSEIIMEINDLRDFDRRLRHRHGATNQPSPRLPTSALSVQP